MKWSSVLIINFKKLKIMSELTYQDLFHESKEFREEMASAYLASVLRKDVELSNRNMSQMKFALDILLHEDLL